MHYSMRESTDVRVLTDGSESGAERRRCHVKRRLLRDLARRDVVQRDHPLAIALAHQARVDAVLRLLRTIQLVAADLLRRVRAEHLDLDVEEVQRAARLRGAAVIADVVIERALP